MPFGHNSDRSKYEIVRPLPVEQGGTGANNAEDARESLEVYGKNETYTKEEIDAKHTDSGWQTLYSGSTYNYAGQQVPTYVRYRKINGIVYVLVKATRTQLTGANAIPAGYRPGYEICEAAPLYDKSYSAATLYMTRVRLGTNGKFATESNMNTSDVIECAFTYPAA